MSEELRNPIVFQCTECSTVITDSFFLLDKVDDSLVFEHVPNSSVDYEIHTSQSSSDSLCTYKIVRCLCKKEIGKKYITVTEAMTRCLSKISLHIKCITGYQLGLMAPMAESVFMSNSEINAEILKLQRFCTYLYNKISEK